MTTQGVVTQFSTGLLPAGAPERDFRDAALIEAGMIAGPDGNVWFEDPYYSPTEEVLIGRITPSGTITLLNPGLSYELHLATGADGNVWFTTREQNAHGVGPRGAENHVVRRISPGGSLTTFPLPKAPGPCSSCLAPIGSDMVAGPDGNVWFSAVVVIGRITPTGTVTYFKLPAGARVQTPGKIVVGPDGNLWFPDMGKTKAIGRISPAGVITEFSKGLNQHNEPHSIIAGPDGNLWFLEGCRDGENTCPIGRITPSGVITEFVEGLPKYARVESIALGADHNIWGTECVAPRRGGTCSVIARITVDATNRALCVVPKLRGKTLSRARRLLARAHCKLGKVAQPANHKHTLVVVSQKPAANKTLPNGAKVSLRLA